MFTRTRPTMPSGRKSRSLHIVWFLAVAYLCGVLTVPLVTLSGSIVGRRPGAGAEQVTVEEKVADPEPVRIVAATMDVVRANPITRKPQAEAKPLQFDPYLVLDRKHPTDFYRFKSECPPAVTNAVDVRSFILDTLFDGVSPFENFPPEHAVPYLQKNHVKGWGSRTKVFERLVNEVQPEVVIELGAFLGASAIHMANLTRNLGLQSTILCVDDFRGWAGFRNMPRLNLPQENGNVMLLYQFMQNVLSEGFHNTIIPIPYATTSALTKFCEWGVKADLIEVDAGHDFHSAWLDINEAFRVLKPGGVMFGHDYFNNYDKKGVARAVDLFAKTYGFRVEPDGQHWILRDTP